MVANIAVYFRLMLMELAAEAAKSCALVEIFGTIIIDEITIVIPHCEFSEETPPRGI